MKIAVLGATGLVGHIVAHYLSNNGFDVTAYSRKWELAQKILPNCEHLVYKDKYPEYEWLTNQCSHTFDYTINCVVVKNTNQFDADSLKNAIDWNVNFVHALATKPRFGKIIHISTDCVFPATPYCFYGEDDPHQCSSVYSMTKSLSEVPSSNVMTLRTSFVGHEIVERVKPALLEWFLMHEGNVQGFLNNRWNGITALQFAKICGTLIEKDLFVPTIQHLVPSGAINKYELLCLFKKIYKKDIEIIPANSPSPVERVLYTKNSTDHSFLWNHDLKTIEQLIIEMHEYNAKHGV